MSEDVDCVGKVKEDQAANDRVKGLDVLKCPHVGLNEYDVVLPSTYVAARSQHPMLRAHDFVTDGSGGVWASRLRNLCRERQFAVHLSAVPQATATLPTELARRGVVPRTEARE
jgi:hypothetical protein